MLDKIQETPNSAGASQPAPLAGPHAALREEVRAVMARDDLSQRDVADESGVPYGTLTPWMGGTYQGRGDRIAAEVQKWLDTRRARARTVAALPPAPPFVLTQTANDIHAILSFSQVAPDFGVIVGGAGIGKTSAIEEYARRASNVWVVTGEPTMNSHHNLLAAMAHELGVLERRSNCLSRAIVAKLRGSGGLVVIDEAQHLSGSALDQLRTTVLDLARCGVAVSGNETVLTRLQGGDARTSALAQLHSRVGMRKTQTGARPADIAMLIERWGVVDEKAARMLTTIARKPGALRVMTKAIRLAAFVAGSANAADIAPVHVERAWAQLSATRIEE